MIRKRVQNDVVVSKVAVESLPGKKTTAAKKLTVSRALANLAGKAKNLPPDASSNIDHVLYRLRRKGS
jgi:hypothetical protein